MSCEKERKAKRILLILLMRLIYIAEKVATRVCYVLATDSEESECSSLERDKNKDLYSKVNRKPTPHKKKHKQKGPEGQYITQINIDHRRQSDQERLQDLEHGIRGMTNSVN